MSDEWKYGPRSTRRDGSPLSARFEENEPFLRPMAADQLFRPGASTPIESPVDNRRLTHRQGAASARPAQWEPGQANDYSGYAYDRAPSGYAPVPQPAMPYYPQPGYMPYPAPAPMGGYYADAPTGGAWPYPDPYAYPQPPYGGYPSFGAQPPVGAPGYPPPYASAYAPYAQTAAPTGSPHYSTPAATPMGSPHYSTPAAAPMGSPPYSAPAATPSMQSVPPIRRERARRDATVLAARPPAEVVPKQAVLQTVPPASMPGSEAPPVKETYLDQPGAGMIQSTFPSRNYATDYNAGQEPERTLGVAYADAPKPVETETKSTLYPPVEEFMPPRSGSSAASQIPLSQAWAEPRQTEGSAKLQELTRLVESAKQEESARFEAEAQPGDHGGTAQFEAFTPPLPQISIAREEPRPPEPTPSFAEESPAFVPVAQTVAVARAVPVQMEEAPARAESYAASHGASAGGAAISGDWEDDELEEGDVTGIFREAPEPLPVPADSARGEERGHSGFVTFLLTVTLLISLAVVYFTGVVDEALTKVGIPIWKELTVKADEDLNTPRVFDALPGTDSGTAEPGDAIIATPEFAPASASGSPRLLSMSVEPAMSKAPATLFFTMKSNSAVTNVQLRNESLELLSPSEVSNAPSGDGMIWNYIVEFEQPYQGLVTAYLSDESGQWDKSGYSCQVSVQ